MAIATRTSLDEAMQLSRFRLRVPDPELKHGQVEMVTINAKQCTLPTPWGMEGGFAVVYKFRTQSNQVRAVRVFKKTMPQDTCERYRLLGDYFSTHAPKITVNFRYHEQGLKVVDPYGSDQHFSLIDMAWVEGVTLLEYVDGLCQQRDRTRLKQLLEQWKGLYAQMQAAQIAHGDLAGGNVMVDPKDQKLVLIDYDGVYIPNFQGRSAFLAGQPSYQHPGMQDRPFNERMDDFSWMVIYTSLAAVAAHPELWEKYVTRNEGGKIVSDGMMFSSNDFLPPFRTPLLGDLARIKDSRVKEAVGYLLAACKMSVDQVRVPPALIDPDYAKKQALAQLVTAIQQDDDCAVRDAWVSSLRQYPSAQIHLQRVELAHQRLAQFDLLCTALAADDDAAIENLAAHPLLQDYKGLQQSQITRIELARKKMAAFHILEIALKSNDDREIEAEYTKHKPLLDSNQLFTKEQRKRVALASERRLALQGLGKALRREDDDEISVAWQHLVALGAKIKLQGVDQKRIDLAQRRSVALKSLRIALQTDNDEEICRADDPILNRYTKITHIERQRIDLAQRRRSALHRFLKGMLTEDEREIVAAYDTILDAYPGVPQHTRETLATARRCVAMPERVRAALALQNDDQIIDAYDPALVRPWMGFTVSEDTRIQLALARKNAWATMQEALATDDDQQIERACRQALDVNKAPLVAGYSGLPTYARARIDLASRRLAAMRQLLKALTTDDDRMIAGAYDLVLDNYPKLTENDRRRIAEAQRCVAMPEAVRAAIKTNKDDELAASYVPQLERTWMAFTPDELARIQLAQARVSAWQRFAKALSANDDNQIIAAYDPVLDGYYRFGALQRRRWEDAKLRVEVRNKVRSALKTGDERLIAAVNIGVLGNDSGLTMGEKSQIATAVACVALPAKVREAILTEQDEAIDKAYDRQLLRPWMDFSSDERERIALAQKHAAALRRFRQALERADEREIDRAYDPILDNSSAITAKEKAQLELARRCVTMHRLLSHALTTHNDEQLVASYDKSLVRPWMRIDDVMLAHIQEAQERLSIIGEVLRQLDLNNIERALDLEKAAGFPIQHSRLTRAKRAFVAHQDPQNLEAIIINGKLRATWRWPDSRHVHAVAVAWRGDRWPTVPEEAGTNVQRITRKGYEQNGFMVPVPVGTSHLFVRLFSALNVHEPDGRTQVFYSRGEDPSARVEIAPRPVLSYRLIPQDGRRFTLEIESKDRISLPSIMVVRTKERLALHQNDGDMVLHVERQPTLQSSLQTVLDGMNWPLHSVLRVFASHNGRDWYAASDRIDVPNS